MQKGNLTYLPRRSNRFSTGDSFMFYLALLCITAKELDYNKIESFYDRIRGRWFLQYDMGQFIHENYHYFSNSTSKGMRFLEISKCDEDFLSKIESIIIKDEVPHLKCLAQINISKVALYEHKTALELSKTIHVLINPWTDTLIEYELSPNTIPTIINYYDVMDTSSNIKDLVFGHFATFNESDNGEVSVTVSSKLEHKIKDKISVVTEINLAEPQKDSNYLTEQSYQYGPSSFTHVHGYYIGRIFTGQYRKIANHRTYRRIGDIDILNIFF